MVRSLFGSASVWSSLAVLALSGSASAQWFPFGGSNSCNCGPRPTLLGSAPIMQSASFSSYGAAMPAYQTAYATESVSCGQPINCTVTQPVQVQAMAIAPVVQTVKVQAMQPVVHPVYDTVHVTEYQQVKQKVQRPVVEVKMVSQAVTEMRPVTQQRTVNVPTVDYQTVTEYKQVQKQVGYWATKTEATGKVPSCQYDNRPGFMGWMNRTGYDVRNAFTPTTKVSRTFVPQTMTCTVPCSKRVAVPGMKQVTYNVTSMVPQQTTRQVAVNTVRYEEVEIVAMKPVTVAKMMQVGTRVSYAPVGSTGGVTASGPTNSGPTALTPTADPNSSARRPAAERTATGESADPLEPDQFNKSNGQNPRKISYPVPAREARESDRGEVTDTVIPTRPALKTPSVIRVSQWVARTPIPGSPQLDKAAGVSIAGTVR
jgi:hypothetical protein